MTTSYIDRYKDLKIKISELERMNNREICLVVVSKKQSIEKIITLNDLGQIDFGENYVDEAEEKISGINTDRITWHFIGRIQSNKIKKICSLFGWVHTISSKKHLIKVNEICKSMNKIMNICIQINIDNDDNKAGIALENYENFIMNLHDLRHVRLRGIMTIPQNNSSSQNSFSRMNDLFKKNNELDTLSMGMSRDYISAIENGANMLRIGQGIFGKRI
tara:strand:- start:1384 stop:2040 length:657 start_codon:yes stop_codon:yes gene_type:complete